MSDVQKVIRYFATAFAILLAVGIITGIVSLVLVIVNGVSGENISIGHADKKTVDFSKSFTDQVESLDIENSAGELKIMQGETFKVEATKVSEDFEARVNEEGKLIVSDDHRGFHFLWFNFNGFHNTNSKVTVYIPADFIADEARIDTGAGNVSLEGLQADYLYISAGAGNINGDDITAGDVKIDGGVGNVTLDEVDFTDVDLDCGVGNLNINGKLLGKTKIDCGVGEVELNLSGSTKDYGFDIDSGIGSVKLNGEKLKESDYYNQDAENIIKVDGGIGNVKINMEE